MFREMKLERQKQTSCNKVTVYLCIAVLIFLVSTLPASATIVAETDNFPGNSDIGYAPDDPINGFSGDLSFSFTTDATNYTFNSVNLFLGTGVSDGIGGNFLVALSEDNGAIPGDFMEVLSGDTDPTQSDIAYQYSGSSILTANTTYWISLMNMDTTGNSLYDFLSAGTTDESASSVWSIGDDIYSSIAGGFIGATGPFLSQFDATIVTQTPVPEPASALLFMVGLIGIVGLRRK